MMSRWARLLRIGVLVLVGASSIARIEVAAAGVEETCPAEAAPAPASDEATAKEEKLPPELRMVLDKLDEANEKLKDVTARVIYESEIPLLDDKQRCRGSLIFRKPDCILLKLGKPRNEDLYTNGKTWWLVSHNYKQVEIYQAAEPGEGGQETAFLDFAYGSSSEKLLKDYRVELVRKEKREKEEETLYRLKFTPRPKKDRRARYAAIEVEVSDKGWLPRVLVLHESGGDIIHTYRLSKIKTNTDVKQSIFECKPPRGYNIFRPEEF